MEGHRLGVLLWIYVCVLDDVAGTCTVGQYGSTCSYQCHCPQAKCDPTSGCQPQDCSTGWCGPTCQKENIALNKTTTSSDGYTLPSSNAVNGDRKGDNETRCILSAYDDANITSAWWRVDLGQKTLIHDVIIYFRTNYIVRRNGIQIYIADTDNSSTDGVNCYNVTGNRDGTGIADVLTVPCSVEGRYLVLYTTTVNNDGYRMPIMDFCEVEVNVCGPGTFGTNCSNYCHCKGKPCNSVNGVCPSRVCLPGWKMDKCDTACDGGSYGTNCTQTCSNRNCKSVNSSCNHVTGKCLGGCKAGWAGTDCTQECVHSYGVGCAHQCSSRNCNGTSICNHVTGQCENGCRPGWKNIDCRVECVQGLEYSAGCEGNCSARMCEGGTDTCPWDTGRCESGCQSGWKGEDCSTVCIGGDEYGAGCKGNCSARKCQGGSGTCPRDTGQCESGCQSGWKGQDCTTECVDSYGVGCAHQCSSRNCNGTASCNPVTGQCENGCRPGWKNVDCTVACVQGLEYSVGCGRNCSARMCEGGTDTCPRDTGRCGSGCQSGWKGEDCSTVCSRGTYGANCTAKCGQCRDSKTCHHVNGTCPSGRIDGWTDHHCKQETKNNNAPFIHSISLVIGLVVGVVMTLLLGGAVHLYLLRRGSLAWTHGNVKDDDRRDTVDPNMTPADNYTSISELPRTDGRNTQDNDYAGLDEDTRTDNKHYDVIQNKVYVNT